MWLFTEICLLERDGEYKNDFNILTIEFPFPFTMQSHKLALEKRYTLSIKQMFIWTVNSLILVFWILRTVRKKLQLFISCPAFDICTPNEKNTLLNQSFINSTLLCELATKLLFGDRS